MSLNQFHPYCAYTLLYEYPLSMYEMDTVNETLSIKFLFIFFVIHRFRFEWSHFYWIAFRNL